MEQDIRKALEEPLKGAGAYWRHNGDAQAPHAVLTSGLHSDFFFNSEKVMERPTLLDEVACGLVSLFPLEHQRIDRDTAACDRMRSRKRVAITFPTR